MLDVVLWVFAATLIAELILIALLLSNSEDRRDEIAVCLVVILIVFLILVFVLAVGSWMRLFLS